MKLDNGGKKDIQTYLGFRCNHYNAKFNNRAQPKDEKSDDFASCCALESNLCWMNYQKL